MKKTIALVIGIMLTLTAASAEIFVPGNSFGKDAKLVVGGVMQETNFLNTSGAAATMIAPMFVYGLTEKLDVIGAYGVANITGLSPLLSSAGASGYAAVLKYGLLDEGKDLPVSVGLRGSYKNMSMTMTAVSGATASAGIAQVGGSVVVSKMLMPITPYGAVSYRRNSTDGAEASNQVDITLGGIFMPTERIMILAEYNNQSITPKGASSYTSPQIGVALAYML